MVVVVVVVVAAAAAASASAWLSSSCWEGTDGAFNVDS